MALRIGRRYAKTIMASHRRQYLPEWVAFNRYQAFKTRQRYGRYTPITKWHKKKIDLTIESLEEALIRISRMIEVFPKRG